MPDDLSAIADICMLDKKHTGLRADGDIRMNLDQAVQQLSPRFFGGTNDTKRDIFVAELENHVVGFVNVSRNAPDLPRKGSEVYLILVHNDYVHRYKGIGSKLLAVVRTNNQCESWTRCPRANHEAIKWFKFKGYQYHHTEVGEDGTRTVLRWPGSM